MQERGLPFLLNHIKGISWFEHLVNFVVSVVKGDHKNMDKVHSCIYLRLIYWLRLSQYNRFLFCLFCCYFFLLQLQLGVGQSIMSNLNRCPF